MAEEINKAVKDRALKKAQQAQQENPNLKLIDASGALIAPNSPEAKTNRDGTPVVGIHPNARFVQEAYKDLITDEGKVKPVSEFETATRGEYPSAVRTKNEWVNQRASDLQKLRGLTPAQAKFDAELEYEQQFMKPVKPGFGEYGDRKPPVIMLDPAPATGKATLKSAIRPQTFMGEDELISERERQDKAGAAGVAGSAPFDWPKLKEKLVASGLTSEQADSMIAGYKKVYNKKYQIYKDPKKTWEETLKSLENTQQTLKDKTKWSKDPTKVYGDVNLSNALKAQTRPGEGIPNLTEDEQDFLSAKREEERRIARLKVDKMTPPPVQVKSNLKGGISTYRPMTDAEIKAWRDKQVDELVPKEIYEDPEKYSKAKEGLVEWEPGVLEERNTFGGTRETTTGWVLRSAGAAWNALAGALIDAAPELTYGFGFDDPNFAQEMRGKEKKEGKYKDNPVLANIAEGKGFGGEFAEAADTMWGDDTVSKQDLLFQVLRTGYVGGAYAADMLDPTFEIAGALGAAAKAGSRISKAAKATGTAMSAGDIIKYGAKEGAKDLAREVGFGIGSEVKAFAPGDVRSTIAENLSKELNAQSTIKNAINNNQPVERILAEAAQADTAIAKAYRQEINNGSSPKDAYKIVAKSDPVASQIDDAMEAIDDLRRGNIPVKSREKDIARQLGVLARDNPGVYDILKAVDNTKPKGSKLVAYMQELNTKNIDALKARVINDIARKEVYKATANQAGFDNFVQLTRNSFTTKVKAKEILEKAAASEIGKLSESLKTATPKLMEVPVETRAFATDVAETTKLAPVVDLSNEQSLVIAKTLQQLVGLKVFPVDTAKIIIELVRTDKVITLRDLRKILDAEIDLIAEAQPTIIRARDMNLLSDPQKTERLLQPIETKHFGADLFVDFVTKFFRDIKGQVDQTVSPAQRTILQQALQKSGNLDVALRNSMAKALNDPDFRKAYGMPVDSQPTRQTALAYLVTGPEVGKSSENIKSVLESTVQSLIFESTSKEAIFDQVTGAKSFRDNSIFNGSGIQQIDSVIETACANILQNPSNLWEEMMQVVEFAENLSKDPTYLKTAIEPSKVTRITEDIAKKTGKKSLPPEVQVGAFYRAEMDRIAKESLQEIVSGTAKTTTPNIEQSISNSAKVILKNIADAEATRLKELGTDLLLEQGAVTSLKGTLAEQVAEGKILSEENYNFIKKTKEEFATLKKEQVKNIDSLEKEKNLKLETLKDKENLAIAKATTKAEKESIKEKVSLIRQELQKTYDNKKAEVIANTEKKKKIRLQAAQSKGITLDELKITLKEEILAGKGITQDFKTLAQKIKEERKELNLSAKEQREQIATLLDEEELKKKILKDTEEARTLRAATKAEKQKIKEEFAGKRENLEKIFAEKRAEVGAGITQRKETREAIKTATESLLATKYKIKQEDISRMEKVIAGENIKADLIGDLVTSRLAKNVSGENIGKYSEMSIQDIIKDLPDSWKASTAITKNELMEIIVSADEVAKTIQIANKIPTSGSVDDISSQIAKYFQDPKLEEQARLLFGSDIYKQINTEIGKGGERLNKALEDLVAKEYGPNQHIVKKILSNANDVIQDIFYTLTLTAAPRFHFGNILGAPGILYKTLGATGIRSLGYLGEAMQLIAQSALPNAALSKIIVTDKAGRSYTAGEVYQMISEIGTQSQFSKGTQNVAKDMVNIITDTALSKGSRYATNIQRMAEAEDKTFRTMVLLKALEDGRGADEAIKLARASLYDLGDVGKIVKAEKIANQYLVFYNFARNNLINTLQLLTSAQGLSRIGKYYRFTRAVEGTPFVEIDSISTKEKAMMSEYAQSRIILDTLDIGKDKYAIAFAPDAMLDGLNLLGAIAEGQIMDKIFGMVRPIFKEEEEKEPTKIDPEFVAAMNLFPDAMRNGILMVLTGSKDINPQIIEGEGKKIETVYPLDTPSQRSHYKKLKNFLNFFGLSRIISDFGKTFAAEGTATDRTGMGLPGQVAYTTAIATPLKIANAERVALYNTLSQTAEGKKFIKDIEKVAQQPVKIASEEESNIVKLRSLKQAEKAEQRPKTKKEQYDAADSYDRHLDRLYRNGKISRKQIKEMAKAFRDNGFLEPQSNVEIAGVKYQE